MTKKCLQWKSLKGWERVTAQEIREMIESFFPDYKNKPLKYVVRVAIQDQSMTGVPIRFDDIAKCRDASYRHFTQTSEYFEGVEQQSMEDKGVFPW